MHTAERAWCSVKRSGLPTAVATTTTTPPRPPPPTTTTTCFAIYCTVQQGLLYLVWRLKNWILSEAAGCIADGIGLGIHFSVSTTVQGIALLYTTGLSGPRLPAQVAAASIKRNITVRAPARAPVRHLIPHSPGAGFTCCTMVVLLLLLLLAALIVRGVCVTNKMQHDERHYGWYIANLALYSSKVHDDNDNTQGSRSYDG